jgi:hypothetical protein
LDVWRGDPEKGFGNMMNKQREQPAIIKEKKIYVVLILINYEMQLSN